MTDTQAAADWVAMETKHASGAYAPKPITFVRGEGVRMWDADGKEYIDCGTGIGVAALGHAHPALTKAIADQASTLMTVAAGYYHNDVRSAFMKKLAQIAPEGMNRVFVSNSGTESIEAALKMAKLKTGRTGVVAAIRGFHGRTMGTLGATWKKTYREPFFPLVPGYSHVPFGDVHALQNEVTKETAAVLLEPIQGEGGIYPAPEGYLGKAREICDKMGALLILDEVQSGMGRTGKWFACEHDGVIPDALCLAKALGAGVPIGATVFKDEFEFDKGQHGSTFGGNPLACRAGLTVIEIIESEKLLDHVTEVGEYFKEGLLALADLNPDKIKEVRGMGLMLAVQLKDKVGPVLNALQENGVLGLGATPTSMRFLPPFIISKDEVDHVLSTLDDVL